MTNAVKCWQCCVAQKKAVVDGADVIILNDAVTWAPVWQGMTSIHGQAVGMTAVPYCLDCLKEASAGGNGSSNGRLVTA